MITKEQLIGDILALGIRPEDTLLIHSSMKAVGEVEGGADTVLDAFSEVLRPGLLILPTHSWATIGENHTVFNPMTEPSCVGILTNLFMRRPGVLRSLHPTHSVAALGADARSYTAGEETRSTPCPRNGCWGKLIDRHARILFLGCRLRSNTFLHGVEEWNNIPNRLTKEPAPYKIEMPDGSLIDRPMHRHESPIGDVSRYYGKMEEPFLRKGLAVKGKIGDAVSFLCDAAGMSELTSEYLRRNPDLFIDDAPVPREWYE